MLNSSGNLGWREPLVIVVEAIRTRGASERRWRDWQAAVSAVDQILLLGAWAKGLAPGYTSVGLGLQRMIRPERVVDRSRTRARHLVKRKIDEELGHAPLHMTIEIAREWLALAGPVYRLRLVAAILEALGHAGRAAGLGPPPLRAKPTMDSTTELDEGERMRLGRWLRDEMEATPRGGALVIAHRSSNGRRFAMRQRFVDQLGAHDELALPAKSERFVVWRVAVLPPPAATDQAAADQAEL